MSLKQAFNLTDEGELKDYLGMHFNHYPDAYIELQQQKTIDICLKAIGLGAEVGSTICQQNQQKFCMPILGLEAFGTRHASEGACLFCEPHANNCACHWGHGFMTYGHTLCQGEGHGWHGWHGCFIHFLCDIMTS